MDETEPSRFYRSTTLFHLQDRIQCKFDWEQIIKFIG